MDEHRLKESDRCPDARFIFKAVLRGYRLVFTGHSETDVAADAMVDPASDIWGVVYDITETDRKQLDAHDGVERRTYRPKEVLVHPNGDFEQRVLVLTFTINNATLNQDSPTREYLNSLLRGARRWDLPPNYIAQLDRIKALD